MIKMSKGTETLTFNPERVNNEGTLRITIEKRDAKNAVVSRNFMLGQQSDLFNLRCKAWNEGWK